MEIRMEILKFFLFLTSHSLLQSTAIGTSENVNTLKIPSKRETTTQYTYYNHPTSQNTFPFFPNNRKNYSQRYYSQPSSENRSKSLAVPQGTILTLTPELKMPIMNTDDLDHPALAVGATFVTSFPITLTFKEMKFGNEWNWNRKSILHWGHADPVENDILDGGDQLHSRIARDVNFVQKRNATGKRPINQKCLIRQITDRAMILQKLEAFGGNFGMENPKACLLRAACEIHEMPTIVHSALGIVGEIVTSIFSVEKLGKNCGETILMKTLSSFAEAELAGKSKNCYMYKKICSKSIFM